MLPSLLINYRVYGDDSNDMIGTADVEIPKFEAITETIEGAGLAGKIDMPVIGHYDTMETKLNFRTIDSDAIDLSAPKTQKLEFRAAQEAYDQATGEMKTVPVKLVIKGMPKSNELGKLQMGTKTDSAVTIETLYLKLTIDGEEKVEIDKLNYIARINGKDYLADVRSALGI